MPSQSGRGSRPTSPATRAALSASTASSATTRSSMRKRTGGGLLVCALSATNPPLAGKLERRRRSFPLCSGWLARRLLGERLETLQPLLEIGADGTVEAEGEVAH